MSTMNKKNWRMGIAGFTYASLAVAPVYASDVEIYTQSSSSTNLSPVMMMMFDTSGSMETKDCKTRNSKGKCTETYTTTRMERLKAAMTELLTGSKPAPGYVRMGLSRYQPNGSNGGWVLYPAKPLDALVNVSPDGENAVRVDSSGGDTSGTTITDSSFNVSSSTDGGLYFANVAVPKGAVIKRAYIELTAKNTDPTDTIWQVAIENVGNAAPYSSTVPLGHSSRNTYFLPTSALAVPGWDAEDVQSLDVTEQVAKVVTNNSAWCGGNGMAFRIRDLAGQSRTAYSWDGDSAKAARLVVEYSVDPESTTSCMWIRNQLSNFYLGLDAATGSVYVNQARSDDVEWLETQSSANSVTSNLDPNLSIKDSGGTYRRNMAALRLSATNKIPKNAVIESAELVLTPVGSLTTRSTDIRMFKNTNMSEFCSGTTTSSCTIPSYGATNLSATKTWGSTAVTGGTPVAIDVKDLVASVVSGSTATSVETLSFLLNATSTGTCTAAECKVQFYAADTDYAKAPYLRVKWSSPSSVTSLAGLETVRDQLMAMVNKLDTPSNTPLGAAYAESARYILGMDYTRASSSANYPDRRTYTGTTYVSPIDRSDQCSGNYIFLLTDGAPTADANVASSVAAIKNPDAACTLPPGSTVVGSYSDAPNTWTCMADLADNLRDISKNPLGVSVRTSAMFLGGDSTPNDVANLKMVTEKNGGGRAFTGSSSAEIVKALEQTIEDAISNTGLIAAPGVAVNQYNRLNSLDQVYYVLFDPTSASKRWDGNLKRYKLSVSTEAILDVNDQVATDADGGFKRDSKSFWSDLVDGSDSTAGGAAGELPHPSVRNIYTNILGTMNLLDLGNATLVASGLALMPTGTTQSTFKNLVNWYKGYDIPDAYGIEITESTTPKLSTLPERKKLGGGLHSRATLVNYGFTAGTDKTDPANQNNIIFYSTLGGTLHGIDAKTGVEKFAFIPKEKIPAIKTLYDNLASTEPEYGLDLTWTVWRKDGNGDGLIDSTAGDKLYMYGGMRMGGGNYYALDLTTLTAPKMLFTLTGGAGAYGNAGQSWSQPVLTDIKVGSDVKKVLVFGGGYDMCYEDGVSCGATTKGNQIYIVDAETGGLIWWAAGAGAPSATPSAVSISDMKYSIPSEVKVLDLNSDGLADTVYFGDLGGQLFRMDIDNGKSGSALVKRVKLIAKLGSTGVSTPTSVDARRIYEPPTVALFKDETMSAVFAAVAVGTGNRSRPLSMATNDRFAVVFDYDIGKSNLLTVGSGLQATLDYSKLVKLDLTNDASTGKPVYSIDTTTGKYVPGTYGWYVELTSGGEKSLSSGLIFLKKLLFTTYLPVTAQNNGCNLVAGETDLYQMCMPYGTQCGDIEERKVGKIMLGLGGEPQLIYQNTGEVNSEGTPTATIGTLISTTVSAEKKDLVKQLQTLKRWREKNSQ